MKVCGIELKGSEARMVALEGTIDDYRVVATTMDRVKIGDSKDQKSVQAFHQQVIEFFDAEDFTAIGIKERMTKGRFSGGALTFKMEALLQTSDYAIQIIHVATIKSKLKNIEYDEELVNKYQGEAFRVALYLLETI